MFSFFRKDKISIKSISIPDFGGRKEKDDDAIIQWVNQEEPIAVSINYFDKIPDIPTIKDVNMLRGFYRDLVLSINGGIIEVELFKRQELDIVRTIFKIPKPVKGMMYIGSLTIPFSTCSFVLKVQADEFGATGMREAIVVNKLFSTGSFGEATWSADPYDKAFTDGHLMNQAEDQIYDAEFPAHPLSRVRTILDQIEKDFQFDTSVKKLKPFHL